MSGVTIAYTPSSLVVLAVTLPFSSVTLLSTAETAPVLALPSKSACTFCSMLAVALSASALAVCSLVIAALFLLKPAVSTSMRLDNALSPSTMADCKVQAAACLLPLSAVQLLLSAVSGVTIA